MIANISATMGSFGVPQEPNIQQYCNVEWLRGWDYMSISVAHLKRVAV